MDVSYPQVVMPVQQGLQQPPQGRESLPTLCPQGLDPSQVTQVVTTQTGRVLAPGPRGDANDGPVPVPASMAGLH